MVLICLALAGGWPVAARGDASGSGKLLRLAGDPAGQVAAALIAHQPGTSPTVALGLQPLDADGAASAAEADVTAGVDASVEPYYGPGYGVAFDPARRRFLVAFTGTGPGMATEPCPPSPGPVSNSPGCVFKDREIFVRLVDASGAAIGAPRRISTTGPASSAHHTAVDPDVAYDPRTGGFAVVWAAHVTGESSIGTYEARALDADGAPTGPAHRLHAGTTLVPAAFVAGNRRGIVVALGWRGHGRTARVYATALDHAAHPGRLHLVDGPGDVLPDALAAAPGRATALLAVAVYHGEQFGYELRALHLDGKAAGRVHAVSSGTWDLVRVAPDTAGSGWLVAGSDAPSGSFAPDHVYVQRTRADGLLLGHRRRIASRFAYWAGMAIAPLAGGRALAGWSLPRGPSDMDNTWQVVRGS